MICAGAGPFICGRICGLILALSGRMMVEPRQNSGRARHAFRLQCRVTGQAQVVRYDVRGTIWEARAGKAAGCRLLEGRRKKKTPA
jgi:hypothetical protein